MTLAHLISVAKILLIFKLQWNYGILLINKDLLGFDLDKNIWNMSKKRRSLFNYY